MDDSSEDQRQPHMTDPPQFVSLDDLKTLGVLYFEVGCEQQFTRLTKFTITNCLRQNPVQGFILPTLAVVYLSGVLQNVQRLFWKGSYSNSVLINIIPDNQANLYRPTCNMYMPLFIFGGRLGGGGGGDLTVYILSMFFLYLNYLFFFFFFTENDSSFVILICLHLY